MKQLTQQELNALKPGAKAYYVTIDGPKEALLKALSPKKDGLQRWELSKVGAAERRGTLEVIRYPHESDGWFTGEYDLFVVNDYKIWLHKREIERCNQVIRHTEREIEGHMEMIRLLEYNTNAAEMRLLSSSQKEDSNH